MPDRPPRAKPKVRIKAGRGMLHIQFTQQWAYVGCVRSFIENFCAISLDDKKLAGRISVAASELLENAVKYGGGRSAVEARIRLGGEWVTLQVTNAAAAARRRILRREIRLIKQGRPRDAFIGKIREIAENGDGPQRLGLARIRYETQPRAIRMTEKGDAVTVTVTFAPA